MNFLRNAWCVVLLAGCGNDDAMISRPADMPNARVDAGSIMDAARVVPIKDATVAVEAAVRDEEQPRTGSCFGRCGMPELLEYRGPCGCDPECLTRGDCCADKHELCAVSDRAALCTLTGVERDPALCGTDLGWSFAHDGKVEVLFGDAYGADCQDPYPNDDAQATLPLERPASLDSCQGLLTVDHKSALIGETFAPILLYEDGTRLSSFLSETPLTGFSDGTNAFMLARRGDTIDAPIYLGVRDASAAPGVTPERTIFRSLRQLTMKQFKNPTAVVHEQTLYLFGRGNFGGVDARTVYLLRQGLPFYQDGQLNWSPSYYAGPDRWSGDIADALPVIENDLTRTMQFDVVWVPALQKWLMLYGGDIPDWIDATPDGHIRHGALHMRMADQPWGPWTRATPVFWREHAAAFMACDATGSAGCDIDELPDDPAHSFSPGLWAPQIRDFTGCIDRDLIPRQPNFMPGGVIPCLGKQRGNLYAPSFIEPWTRDLAGDRGYAHAAELYFMVSTWMPYQVILASLTVHLP